MLERGKAMAGDEPQYIETGGTGVERTRRRKKTRERGAAHVTITPYVPRRHALAVVALSLPVAQRASTQQLPSRDPKPNKQNGAAGPCGIRARGCCGRNRRTKGGRGVEGAGPAGLGRGHDGAPPDRDVSFVFLSRVGGRWW